FRLDGTFDVSVDGTGFTIVADASTTLFGVTLSADGTLQVKNISNVLGLVVDVALATANSAAVAPGSAAPTLAVPGPGFQLNAGLVLQVNTFSTAQTGLRNNSIPANTFRAHGTGSLQLTNSFLLTGTFDVSVSTGGFTIAADAGIQLFN